MPTGYTAAVQDGTITTLREFALQCARQFGALVQMRDEPFSAPIPERFEVAPWYHERIEEVAAELAAVAAMSASDAAEAAEREYAVELARVEQAEAKEKLGLERYRTMLASVQAWEPPTDEHEGLKDFMFDQLRQSIGFDVPLPRERPRKLGGEAWRHKRLGELHTRYDDARKSLDEEAARVRSRNEWVRKLRESL